MLSVRSGLTAPVRRAFSSPPPRRLAASAQEVGYRLAPRRCSAATGAAAPGATAAGAPAPGAASGASAGRDSSDRSTRSSARSSRVRCDRAASSSSRSRFRAGGVLSGQREQPRRLEVLGGHLGARVLLLGGQRPPLVGGVRLQVLQRAGVGLVGDHLATRRVECRLLRLRGGELVLLVFYQGGLEPLAARLPVGPRGASPQDTFAPGAPRRGAVPGQYPAVQVRPAGVGLLGRSRGRAVARCKRKRRSVLLLQPHRAAAGGVPGHAADRVQALRSKASSSGSRRNFADRTRPWGAATRMRPVRSSRPTNTPGAYCWDSLPPR